MPVNEKGIPYSILESRCDYILTMKECFGLKFDCCSYTFDTKGHLSLKFEIVTLFEDFLDSSFGPEGCCVYSHQFYETTRK